MVRQGGSRVFFDVVGQMQAARLISDAEEMGTVVRAIMMDAFDGIKGSLDGIFDSVGAAIEAVREPALALGESQIYFRKFFDFDGVKEYEEAIVDLGVAFGFTGTEALEAGARMAQLGGLFGSGESIVAGTAVGTAFGMIGGMETEEAQTRLISLAQQTGFIYEGMGKAAFFAADAETQRQVVMRNSLYVLDQLNTVENNSVATMQQLSTVMDQFSASATIANMSIAEQAALSATLVESGESASKAGRGLRQMLLRVASDTGGAATALHEFGVATQDINGDMVGLTRIMQQLKDNGFDQLDSAQQMQLATSVAGANHATRFIKLMENFDRVTTLTAQAISRESGAITELNKVMDTATFQHNQMIAAQETLAAEIGQELLPAMTDAEMASYSLKAGFLSLLQMEGDMDSLGGMFEGLAGDLGRAAARGVIVAEGTYQIAGGAFEAFLNYQSLLISIKVYRAIMRQNLDLQNMVSQGLLGQRGAQQQINQLNGIEVNKIGEKLYMKGVQKRLDATLLDIEKQKLGMATVAERQELAQINISKESLQVAQNKVQAETRRLQVIGLAKKMSMDDLTTASHNTSIKIQKEIAHQNEIRETMMLKGSDAMIDKMSAADALAASAVRIGVLEQEQIQIQQTVYAKQELVNIETRELPILNQVTQARIREIQKQREEFIATLNLLKATGHLTKAKHKEMMATLNSATAGKKMVASNQLTMGSLMRLEGQALKSAFSINRFSAASSLASMGLMMFSESEDAMQMSMVLMVMSMAPAIGSMLTFKAATDSATASSVTFQAVTTAGAALVAVGIAFALAKTMFKNASEDMQETTEELTTTFDDVQQSAGDFAFELDKPGGVTDLMLDFGNTTQESMDRAEKSVQSFMSAREELFFGFSPSRMNQTLFDQLVNQGVGELYYRTELNIANNFFGLTIDEMVTQITNQVQENLVAITGS
jgi:TP901 family phage tail tape measure protein